MLLISSLKNNYLELLELKLKKNKLKNNLNYYQKLIKAEEEKNISHSDRENFSLEEKAVELIEKSGSQKLALIHYSCSSEEIILNLKGEFKPLFYFLNWLDKNQHHLDIANLKIKRDGLNLFCYLRLLKNSSLN